MRTLLWLALLVVSACGASMPAATPVTTVARPTPSELRAGVAITDITPPPGLSLFGYGIEARVAQGSRGRLLCQAIVLDGPDDHAALVTCDLAAVSHALVRAIAERLHEREVAFAAQRIFVMASHTHAGPAHYFPEHGFSGVMSTRLTGYDPQMLRWLSGRVAGAIESAARHTEPVVVRVGQRELSGLTTNRSFSAHLRNHEARGASTTPIDPSDAVPKTLSLLRFDRPSGESLAVLAVFGIHNTAVNNLNDLYHADVFGYARSAITQLPHGQAQAPVFALANGAEGDVSPRVHERTAREAQRIGTSLAQAIHTLWIETATHTPSTTLAIATRMLHLPNAPIRADADADTLCASPELGMAAGGGAEDGPTSLRVLPAANEGRRTREAHGCQGHKLVLVAPFSEPGSDPYFMAHYAQASVLHVGSMMLATVPLEVTTQAAARALAAMRSELTPDTPVALIGLTNGYLMYLTTAEEYAEQQYEGAATLYGPNSSQFWTTHLACLAAWHDASKRQHWPARCALKQVAVNEDLLPPTDPHVTPRLPDDPSSQAALDGAELNLEAHLHEGERAHSLSFWGPAPASARAWSRLSARVECMNGNATATCAAGANHTTRVDSRDPNVVVRVLQQQRGEHHRWRITWVPPRALPVDVACQSHRFVVQAEQSTLTSPTFVLRPEQCPTTPPATTTEVSHAQPQ